MTQASDTISLGQQGVGHMHEIISHFMLIRLNMVISVSVFNVEFSTQFHKSFFF